MQNKISFNNCPEDTQYRLNKYLSVYKKFIDLIKLRTGGTQDEAGFTTTLKGVLELEDEAWIRAVSTEFRKLIASDEPINYYKMKHLFFQEIFRNGTEEEETKKIEIAKILRNYEKKFWNKSIPIKYDGKFLSSESTIRITHNQYLFHSGGTKPKNGKSSQSESAFIKIFPESNPLIGSYFTVIINRQLSLALLNECILAFKEDRFSELTLPEGLVPSHRQEITLKNYELIVEKPSYIKVIKFIDKNS